MSSDGDANNANLQMQLQLQNERAQMQQQQLALHAFWQHQIADISQIDPDSFDFKTHQLPLARIKKIMKTDEDVRMISAEAPVLFAKACEMFILELSLRAWIHTEENKRRTLQRNDIAMVILVILYRAKTNYTSTLRWLSESWSDVDVAVPPVVVLAETWPAAWWRRQLAPSRSAACSACADTAAASAAGAEGWVTARCRPELVKRFNSIGNSWPSL